MRVHNIDVRKGLLRLVLLATALAACSTVSTREPVQLVYSDDSGDPWNRLFSLMFTRTVTHRKTSEFADAGPFTRLGENDFRLFPVSTKTFERFEHGDRAIAPFYPSIDFLYLPRTPPPLTDPRFGGLADALSAALADNRPRSPIDRVLMQHDLWAVFDRLRPGDQRLPLLVRMIAKIALAREEIAALPDQYALARPTLSLPDLFAAGSPWQELVWFDRRSHDTDAAYRQATRVFVLPLDSVTDRRAFVDDLRFLGSPMEASLRGHEERGNKALSQLAGAALVMQMLTIDNKGDVVPTPLVYTVQTRMFATDRNGKPATVPAEHELSRRLLRTQPEKGGLQTFSAHEPAYTAPSGNDYGFASPNFGTIREPILGTVATRCMTCHGQGPHLFTFSVHFKEMAPLRLLDQPNEDRARFVAAQKKTREDYKRLRALFAGR